MQRIYMELGILTLIPPIVIILFAIKTKNSTSSLLLGTLICCFMQYKWGFLNGFIDLMYEVAMDGDTAWYVLFVVLFGCVLNMWSSTGATRALAYKLSKYATTQKRTLVLTWIIGLLIFIDDFTSIAVRGTMTKLYDEKKIPRASLSYITDAQASPLNALIPFGTWGLFYISTFAAYEEVNVLGDGMAVYAKTIPFQFYSYASLAISLLFAIGIIKPLGGLKKIYQRAQETGALYSEASAALNNDDDNDEEYDEKQTSKLLLVFFLPLIIFVGCVIKTGDILLASLITIAFMLVLCPILKVAKWQDMMNNCMNGVRDMTSMIVIVFAAYMLRNSLIAIGLPEYVISLCQPFMSPAVLPFIAYIVCCFLAFTSGSNWGSTLPVVAICIPLCAALNGNMYLTMAALVSGAAFGAHACMYCDVTIFTSGCTKIDNMEHATSQLPYCFIGCAIAAVLFLVSGFIF